MKQMAIVMAALLGLAGFASAQFQYWDAADPIKTPKILSATGLFVDLAAGRDLIPAAVPYEVNSALWADGAHKRRWVLLKPGASIVFSDTVDYLQYPDSTVFVEQFSIDTVPGDTLSRVLWETRLLFLKREAPDPAYPADKSDMWHGFSYKWRKDQKEADLVPDTGLKTAIRWYPKGRNRPASFKKWIFPKVSHCFECHRNSESENIHGRTVMGFFTAQLNMPSTITAGVNQLDYLFTRGVFKGVKPSNWTGSPKWHGISSTDPAATLEKKARSYIAANCSGCHGVRGITVGAVFGLSDSYDYRADARMQFEYRPVSWSFGLDTVQPIARTLEEERLFGVYVVTPGYPQKSLILHRQRSRNTFPPDGISAYDPERNQMPPLATFEVDTGATKVIGDWIAGLPKTGSAIHPDRASRHALVSPIIQGRHVHLPAGLAQGNPRVRLLGMDGRVQVLPKVGNGVYAVPASAGKGVYILQVGGERFTRYLF